MCSLFKEVSIKTLLDTKNDVMMLITHRKSTI